MPHAPVTQYFGVMAGIQTSARQAGIIGLSLGPSVVMLRDQFKSNTNEATVFGLQSRIDLALRLHKPLYLNISVQQQFLPQYLGSSLNLTSLNAGFRLQ